jgi:hypothetical protein
MDTVEFVGANLKFEFYQGSISNKTWPKLLIVAVFSILLFFNAVQAQAQSILEKSNTAGSGDASSDQDSISPVFNLLFGEDQESTEKATTDKETSEKAATDQESSDKAVTDKETSDKAASDKESSEKAATDKESSENAVTDKETSDKAASDKESSENAVTDKESSEKAATDKESSSKFLALSVDTKPESIPDESEGSSALPRSDGLDQPSFKKDVPPIAFPNLEPDSVKSDDSESADESQEEDKSIRKSPFSRKVKEVTSDETAPDVPVETDPDVPDEESADNKTETTTVLVPEKTDDKPVTTNLPEPPSKQEITDMVRAKPPVSDDKLVEVMNALENKPGREDELFLIVRVLSKRDTQYHLRLGAFFDPTDQRPKGAVTPNIKYAYDEYIAAGSVPEAQENINRLISWSKTSEAEGIEGLEEFRAVAP